MAQKNVPVGLWSWSPQGSGRRRAISRSKSRNRIATRKKRRENGSRADPSGSNPHSYGDSFSASGFICGSQKDTVARIRDRATVMVRIVIIRFIIFPWGLTKTVWLEVTCTNFDTRKIMSLINRWIRRGTVILRRQNVSIRQRLQSQNGVQM